MRFRQLLSFRSRCFIGALFLPLAFAATQTPATTPGDEMLAGYLRAEPAKAGERCLAQIRTLEAWTSRRPRYREQLPEMLGLWPMPERTDLNPVVTGRVEHDQFAVEKLHFQSMPGLYVT